ncbi:uncharacterized protein [Musca autumnalis]|uniref:uncharacterized protein n=1 Tax=Musca autumnalis TaxID=221902 RepID=UPI003CF7D010
MKIIIVCVIITIVTASRNHFPSHLISLNTDISQAGHAAGDQPINGFYTIIHNSENLPAVESPMTDEGSANGLEQQDSPANGSSDGGEQTETSTMETMIDLNRAPEPVTDTPEVELARQAHFEAYREAALMAALAPDNDETNGNGSSENDLNSLQLNELQQNTRELLLNKQKQRKQLSTAPRRSSSSSELERVGQEIGHQQQQQLITTYILTAKAEAHALGSGNAGDLLSSDNGQGRNGNGKENGNGGHGNGNGRGISNGGNGHGNGNAHNNGNGNGQSNGKGNGNGKANGHGKENGNGGHGNGNGRGISNGGNGHGNGNAHNNGNGNGHSNGNGGHASNGNGHSNGSNGNSKTNGNGNGGHSLNINGHSILNGNNIGLNNVLDNGDNGILHSLAALDEPFNIPNTANIDTTYYTVDTPDTHYTVVIPPPTVLNTLPQLEAIRLGDHGGELTAIPLSKSFTYITQRLKSPHA